MATNQAGVVTKLKWSLPWLVRYPLWRAAQILVAEDSADLKHIILVVANHFEPGVGRQAVAPVDRWCRLARSTGNSLRDHDQTLFRHTYFFPAEQYDCRSIEKLSALQADGLGEVEVHLHHGVEKPDDASNTHRLLETFRDTLAQRHRCLSRDSTSSLPQYAFVHGNSALANSAGGRNCGVDSEMEVLASTGCYADFTLPSAPDQSQVPKINSIYQCGNPLEQARPHRSGPDLKVGEKPILPIIVNGPLVFDWTRRVRGLPVPRIDDGALARNYPLQLSRFKRWQNAQIGVKGRPEWIFIKLHCHAFFEQDQDAMMGEELKRFMMEVLELGESTKHFKLHFATAREAYNIITAAVDGKQGDPGQFRDYRLRPISSEAKVSHPPPK